MANRFCRCGFSVRYRDGRINQVSEKSTSVRGKASPTRGSGRSRKSISALQ
ncbi:hypothetical protein N7541_009510 [Penicillium brevicompactum]|uniref:Uncharacterized protein n=1 Tax=Penicillium brevicompactum TaxID=5074 RepID=A0A9W9UJ19_PENBR|nr:hypothetical protein N7541_009510 [Penicillium brevicompactum]